MADVIPEARAAAEQLFVHLHACLPEIDAAFLREILDRQAALIISDAMRERDAKVHELVEAARDAGEQMSLLSSVILSGEELSQKKLWDALITERQRREQAEGKLRGIENAIKENTVSWLKPHFDHWEQQVAAAEAENAKLRAADIVRAKDISRLTVERDAARDTAAEKCALLQRFIDGLPNLRRVIEGECRAREVELREGLRSLIWMVRESLKHPDPAAFINGRSELDEAVLLSLSPAPALFASRETLEAVKEANAEPDESDYEYCEEPILRNRRYDALLQRFIDGLPNLRRVITERQRREQAEGKLRGIENAIKENTVPRPARDETFELPAAPAERRREQRRKQERRTSNEGRRWNRREFDAQKKPVDRRRADRRGTK